MHRGRSALLASVALLISGFVPSGAGAVSFEADVAPLLEASCLKCHVGTETTPLDLTTLGNDLADRETFRLWERIFDRVSEGEMPPPGARRPAQRIVDSALDAVREALLEANRAERAGQRTPLRRLTRLTSEHTQSPSLKGTGAPAPSPAVAAGLLTRGRKRAAKRRPSCSAGAPFLRPLARGSIAAGAAA